MKFLIPTLLLASALSANAQSKDQTPAPLADINGVIDLTLDSLNLARTARPVAGSSRVGSNPVLFLVGNSTMRTGTRGNGDNGQWGWGYYAPEYFDAEKITVENHALGGTSSRTFYNRLWPEVLEGVKEGDWVIIELGHNDNGPYDSGRARASIPGIGTDSLHVTIQETGVEETVYSYGEYMRRFINETKAKGAHPILMSLTPRLAYDDPDSTKVTRCAERHGGWAKQVAEQEGVPFIDLNEISASKFESFGKEKTKTMFYLDRIHTSAFGAIENARSAVEGIRNCEGLELAQYLIDAPVDDKTGSSRVGDNPVVFVIGDSTVKNKDSAEDGMWGWGSLIGDNFDKNKITVENHAMAGRSTRTFLDEGRWEKVYNALRPGDFVIMQFGHNDIGDINVGKARGVIPGAGPESQVFKMESTGKNQVIYTFGWYLRKFVLDCQEKGATAIILTHTPRNMFDNGLIQSNAKGIGEWTKQAAQDTNSLCIDVNTITGQKLQKIANKKGLLEVNKYYCGDHTHTSKKGARLNIQSIIQGLRDANHPLASYLK